MKTISNTKTKGFTLVEILIVVIVIAIIAAIGIVSYNGLTERSKRAQALAQLDTLRNAIMVAQNETGLSLRRIAKTPTPVWTGFNNEQYGGTADGIDHPCPGNMQHIFVTDTTNGCVVSTSRMLDRLQQVSGTDLSDLKKGDPWGRPYVIDDEEYGSPVELCTSADRVISAGPDGIRDDYTDATEFMKFKTPPAGFDGLVITIPPAQLPHNVDCDNLDPATKTKSLEVLYPDSSY